MEECGFDSNSNFWNYYLVLQQNAAPNAVFFEQKSICGYLRIGKVPTLVFSMVDGKLLLVCGVIPPNSDSTIDESTANKYADLLSRIGLYCREQKRGSKHPICGSMYDYGWRRDYLSKSYGQYAIPKEKKHLPISKKDRDEYYGELSLYIQHLGSLFQQYFPKQAEEAYEAQDKFHSPGLADTHAGNLTVTHNFESAPHVDDDETYAVGGWFNKLFHQSGNIQGGEFVFPEY
jgi:hypothetical protein